MMRAGVLVFALAACSGTSAPRRSTVCGAARAACAVVQAACPETP